MSGPIVAYVHRNDGTDMRVSRECNSLTGAGYEVHFIGWGAAEQPPPHDLMPGVTKHLFRQGDVGRRRSLVGAAGFGLHTYRTLNELRPDVVHVVNEETAALVAPLKSLLGFRLVCDLFDSLTLRSSSRGRLRRAVASSVVALARRASDRLIVTDERRRRRLGALADEAVVVPNFPVDPGEADVCCAPPSDGPVRLYVAGSLSRRRGLESLAALLDRGADVEIISAGWIYDDVAQGFADHSGVTFLGVLTPAESLRRAADCDAIVALYEPSNENNVLASPNKVYDALCVGRPLVINRETSVSVWVEEQDAGELVRYGEVSDLEDVVERLRRARPSAPERARRLRHLFQRGYSWAQAEPVLLAAYEDLLEA